MLYTKEFERVENMYRTIYEDYSRCIKAVHDQLLLLMRHSSNSSLKDLAQFVKRQAAIKNDPRFAGVSAMSTTEVKTSRTKPITVNRALTPSVTRQT